MINVAGSSGNVFNFDDVSAVLESSSGITSSQLYGTEDNDEQNHNSITDPNAVQLRVGNSLGAGGGTGSMYAVASFGNSMGVGGRPQIPPILRNQIHSTCLTSSNMSMNNVNVGASTSSSGATGGGMGPSTSGGIGTSSANIGSSWGNPSANTQYYNGHQASNNSSSTYEPLFLAYSETTAPPPTPTTPNTLPQAPNTGLLRRRSEHRRSGGRREQARRAASVGPSLAPRQPVRDGERGQRQRELMRTLLISQYL